MKPIFSAGILVAALALSGCNSAPPAGSGGNAAATAPLQATPMKFPIAKSETEWQQQLTPEQYRVLRAKGTERPYTGEYWNTKSPGTYRCAGCGEVLFTSDTKFDSGCGWPSYYQPANTNVITEAADHTHGMVRTEVMCSRCGGHLGHVFDDGPQPTGLRYCINSASLKFEPQPEAKP
jgi:peptide-methionine (R)-S-oxide reductase